MAVQHLAKWPAEVKYESSPQRRSACAHLALRSLGRLLADFVGWACCAKGLHPIATFGTPAPGGEVCLKLCQCLTVQYALGKQ